MNVMFGFTYRGYREIIELLKI